MRERLQRAILAIDTAVQTSVIDGDSHARGDQLEQSAILFAISVEPRGLEIDDAYQFAACQHGHGELTLHGVESSQITRVVTDIARKNGLAVGGRDSSNALAQ